MRNKKIQLRQVKKIFDLLFQIFEENDCDFPDRRVIKNKEKAINNILDKITKDKKERELILDNIEKEMFNTKDYTYKPICDNLRCLGYTIIQGE